MAKIGTFGDIVFEVSPKRTQTFKDLQRSGSSKWNDHDIIGQKPKPEFSGPGLQTINFTMLIKAEFGVNPSKQVKKLWDMNEKGKASPFILGGKPYSQSYWVVENLTESPKIIDNKGNILSIEVQVTLKEYPVKKKRSKK